MPVSLRATLAQKAFSHTADYDAAVQAYFAQQLVPSTSKEASSLRDKETPFPQQLPFSYQRDRCLRYGENPHQKAALYVESNPVPQVGLSWSDVVVLQGKPLSYNNIADADAAWTCVRDIPVREGETACVIVKHMNPCGVAVHTDSVRAYQAAFGGDALSAFGGIIAFNVPVDVALANVIMQTQFAEVIVAPGFSPEARERLANKPGWRLLQVPDRAKASLSNQSNQGRWAYHTVTGGLLVQESDQLHPQGIPDWSAWRWAEAQTQRLIPFGIEKSQLSSMQVADLQFAWALVKNIKSNAIVFAKAGMTVGIGAGQMSRIDSVQIALRKAAQAHRVTQGSVMASDAFFPFRDCVDQAAEAGVVCIIQPGGSKNDAAVIAAAQEAGVGMILTGRRHFYH